jgi:hypothetical protein
MGHKGLHGREALRKPVPKTGMGFFVIGREPKPIECLMLF